MPYDILPLRAIVFQALFLMVAIVLEALVLWRSFGPSDQLTRKACVQYAATANLLSTWVGWMVFFIAEPLLPPSWRAELIGYVFFDFKGMPPTLIMAGLIIFLVTFLLKWQAIEWLELLLGVQKAPPEANKEAAKFRGKTPEQDSFAIVPNRPLIMLQANAASFSAITLLLAMRLIWGNPI